MGAGSRFRPPARGRGARFVRGWRVQGQGQAGQLAAIVASLLAAGDVPGATVAIRVAGQPARVFAVGSRDPAATAALAPDARLYVYSVTKLILAVATLQLAARGELALEAPIRAYLPEHALPAPVSVRQLLGHTGGLPDYGGLADYAASLRASPGTPWSDATFLERTLAGGPLFPPGAGWANSNIGYLLIRRLLERVTGQRLGPLLDRALFAPLGLRQTAVVASLADAATLTPGWSRYLDPGAPRADIARRYHPGWVAHGVVASTAGELARLVEAIFLGPLLAEAERAALLAPTVLPFAHAPFRRPAYGLGAMIDAASPHGAMAGHVGGGPGYAAAAFHYAALAGQPTTIAALANGDEGDIALRIVAAVADHLAAGGAGARP